MPVSKPRVALVVDDEPFARLFALQILADQGFDVLEAGDAEEALDAMASNEDVEVLITDVAMPGNMDGFALARHVRTIRPELKIVVASGRAGPGPDDIAPTSQFLPKPYTAQMLLEIIREMSDPVASAHRLS